MDIKIQSVILFYFVAFYGSGGQTHNAFRSKGLTKKVPHTGDKLSLLILQYIVFQLVN